MNLSFDELYCGQIVVSQATHHTLKLTTKAQNTVHRHFGEIPEHLDCPDFQNALTHCREEISQPEFSRLAALCLSEFGIDPAQTMLDTVRLRAVSSGLERVEAAKPVFYTHRDTWYGNPSCQINAWIPLVEVNETNSFQFYPHHFETPIENDSHLFVASLFQEQGGFGKISDHASPSHFPRALRAPYGEPEIVQLSPGRIMFFAAAHLHQTRVNQGIAPRFSLDFRFYREDHLRRGLGAPDPDNRSQGLALKSYRRMSHYLC